MINFISIICFYFQICSTYYPKTATFITHQSIATTANYSRHPVAANGSRMVLAMFVREQMTMGLSNLYDLSWFATDPSWNANIVLPVINNTRMVGIPTMTTHSLSVFYNIAKWQQMYKKLNVLPMVEFEDFIKYTDRNHIRYFFLVRTLKGSWHGPIFEKCNKSVELKNMHSAINSLNVEAIKRNLSGFELSNVRCYKVHVGDKQTLPEQFITRSGLKGIKTFTILLNIWPGIVSRQSSRGYRVVYASNNRNRTNPHQLTVLPYNNYIEQITKKYLKYLTNGKKFIGVHIRAEKIWINKNNYSDEQYIRKCFKLVQNISKQKKHYMILYFGDHFVVNKYGHLLPKGVSMSHLDPSKFNAIENNGLIAQVEQNTLSYAETLVMCGGGSFEMSIKHRFKKKKPDGFVLTVR